MLRPWCLLLLASPGLTLVVQPRLHRPSGTIARAQRAPIFTMQAADMSGGGAGGGTQERDREVKKGRTAVISRPKPKLIQKDEINTEKDKMWSVLLHDDDVHTWDYVSCHRRKTGLACCPAAARKNARHRQVHRHGSRRHAVAVLPLVGTAAAATSAATTAAAAAATAVADATTATVIVAAIIAAATTFPLPPAPRATCVAAQHHTSLPPSLSPSPPLHHPLRLPRPCVCCTHQVIYAIATTVKTIPRKKAHRITSEVSSPLLFYCQSCLDMIRDAATLPHHSLGPSVD